MKYILSLLILVTGNSFAAYEDYTKTKDEVRIEQLQSKSGTQDVLKPRADSVR